MRVVAVMPPKAVIHRGAIEFLPRSQYSICGKTRGSAMYFRLFLTEPVGSMRTWGLKGNKGGYPIPDKSCLHVNI